MRTPARCALACAFLLLWASAAQAADWILATDTVEVRAGATVRIDVVYTGEGESSLPDTLLARAYAGERAWRLNLTALAPAQGKRRRYHTQLPLAARGGVVIDLIAHESSKLAFIADAPPDAVARLVEPRTRPPVLEGALDVSTGIAATSAESRLHEPVLSGYEPMYFLVGSRQGTSARFQLSFKYRLFDDDSGWGRDRPWLTGFYFAYTQNSFWDLSAQSKPFRDTSYRPAVFWQWQRTDEKTWIDAARVGLEHESNGRGGIDSRSINTAFVQPVWRWKLDAARAFTFEPRFIAYLEKSDNPDIQKYRGYVDWRARLGRENGLVLTTNLRTGSSGRGSVQLDASYPLRDELFGRFGGYLHLQYFNGYGEDILGYNQKRDAQIRIGFSIVR